MEKLLLAFFLCPKRLSENSPKWDKKCPSLWRAFDVEEWSCQFLTEYEDQGNRYSNVFNDNPHIEPATGNFYWQFKGL